MMNVKRLASGVWKVGPSRIFRFEVPGQALQPGGFEVRIARPHARPLCVWVEDFERAVLRAQELAFLAAKMGGVR